MPSIEWVSLYGAVGRLESLWGIPQSIAEQIVRNVLQGGKVEVRGVPRYAQVPQIITEQIRSALLPNVLSARDYEDIEIEVNGLIAHGRKLIPSWICVAELPTTRKGSSHKRDRAAQAIKDLWPQGPPDPKDLPNVELCKMVSEKIAEDNRQQNRRQVAISDDTILRAAGRLR